MLNHLKGEFELLHFFRRGFALGYRFYVLFIKQRAVAVLNEQAAVHLFHIVRFFAALGVYIREFEYSQVGFRLKHLESFGGEIGRNDYFEEYLHHFAGDVGVYRAVNRNYAAEYAYGVALVCGLVRLEYRFARAHAAGIGVLARNHRYLVELVQKVERTVCVVYVVVAEFLALQLFRLRQRAGNGQSFGIESRVLLRVFAVAHALLFLVRERDLVGETNAQLFAHIR